MKKLIQYFKLQEEIFDYFGYQEDWVTIPLEEQLDVNWMICGPEDSNSTRVVYSKVPFTPDIIESGENIYSGLIYTQRFLPKWVYRGKDYTMISINTQSDGNRVLRVFTNKLECNDQKLKDLYNEHW